MSLYCIHRRAVVPAVALVFVLAAGFAGGARAAEAQTNRAAAVTTAAPAVKETTNGAAETVREPRRETARGAAGGSGNGTNAVAGNSFEAFRLISERNIFNPNRSPRTARGGATEVKKAPKVDVVGLGGTMIYSKGPVAFFVSPSAQFQKAVRPGDSIAGYTVKLVTNNLVQLESEGKPLELKVGQQLRREDDGPWQVGARTETLASSGGSDSGSGSNSASGSDAAGGNEVLRRLMQKREKQLNP